MAGPESGSLDRLPSTVDLVSTENAHYRVIRSNHERPNTRAEVGEATILCEEISVSPKGVMEYLTSVFLSQQRHVQSREIVKIPSITHMYIVDNVDVPGFKKVEQRENLERALQRMLTMNLAFPLALSAAFGGILSRRRFLTSFGALAIAGTSYLAAPEIALELIKRGYKGNHLESQQRRIQEFQIYFRNLIIAHKAEYIAERAKLKTGRKATIALTTGAEHGLVTLALTMHKTKRQELLSELLNELRKHISKEDVDTIQEYIFLIPEWDNATNTAGVLDMRTGIVTPAR